MFQYPEGGKKPPLDGRTSRSESPEDDKKPSLLVVPKTPRQKTGKSKSPFHSTPTLAKAEAQGDVFLPSAVNTPSKYNSPSSLHPPSPLEAANKSGPAFPGPAFHSAPTLAKDGAQGDVFLPSAVSTPSKYNSPSSLHPPSPLEAANQSGLAFRPRESPQEAYNSDAASEAG
ncbi:hypothetical protein BST61_g11485 [Cercospora zeina]